MVKKRSNRSRFYNKKGIFIISLLIILAVITMFFGTNISGASSSNRPDYCDKNTLKLGSYLIQGKCIPKAVFTELPPYPKNLNDIKLLVKFSKVRDLTTIGEEYYKQPEFYENWDPAGIDSFLNPPGGYFGAFGFGTYPADVIVNLKSGQSFKVGTFFKTSWGIQTYQGMQLITVFPEHAESVMGNVTVDQKSDKVKNYFEVSTNSNLFVLGPTFGVFSKDWVKLVTIDVKVKSDTPSGKYVVGITPIEPPVEYQDKWLSQYGLNYVSAGESGVGRPFFQIFIEVE
jgi:hypothetical protein